MTVVKKNLQRIGNSTGLVLPQDILQDAGMERDDEVVILAEEGRITITRLDPDFDAQIAAAERFIARYPNALKKLGE